jgi:DNA-binding MarR family transcriptional regulator
LTEHQFVLRFDDAPGHLLRRVQQIHTETWSREVGDTITGPQYATVVAIAGWPEVDQKRAGELASLDKSTVGDVVRRLERKGWIVRTVSPHDARRRLLLLTELARERLPAVTTAAARVQDALLLPLKPAQREVFVRLLRKVAFAGVGDMDAASFTDQFVLELGVTPGYLIRRAQQVHSTIWSSILDGDLTSTQYAVLVAAAASESVDQTQIGIRASLDSSSVADIVTRLEAGGWLTRRRDPVDGRRVIVELTVPATMAVRHLTRSVAAVQQQLLAPLDTGESEQFLRLMQKVALIGQRGDRALTRSG